MNQAHESGSNNPELFSSFDIGEATQVVISRMRKPVEFGAEPSPELAAGNVLRRLCALGGAACAETCQKPDGYENRLEKLCADENLGAVIDELSIPAEKVLMVGVTADKVGFHDELISYGDAVNMNSLGIRQLAGYNAFFAKDSEEVVLGARLADCGFAAIEFKDKDSETVRGFVHLTRTNLQGETALKFEVDGEPAGSFEYFLHSALKHYGGDIESVKVRLTSGIKAENFEYTFSNKTPEELFPGWMEQGLLKNVSDPDWQKDQPINPEDIWQPQNREMLHWQIMRSGISENQLIEDNMIDPGDLEHGHASNHAGAHGKMPDGRDTYLVMPR